jgi:hypothetical protein
MTNMRGSKQRFPDKLLKPSFIFQRYLALHIYYYYYYYYYFVFVTSYLICIKKFLFSTNSALNSSDVTSVFCLIIMLVTVGLKAVFHTSLIDI